jgi:hypothetical protein
MAGSASDWLHCNFSALKEDRSGHRPDEDPMGTQFTPPFSPAETGKETHTELTIPSFAMLLKH